MQNSKLENYFDIHHGLSRWLTDMEPSTWYLVDQLVENKKAVGQHPLPSVLGRSQDDMLVVMPEKERERMEWVRQELEVEREKLEGFRV